MGSTPPDPRSPTFGDWETTMHGPYEQWETIKRWHGRLRAVNSEESPEFADYAVVVLLHCFAMRDWLINSGVDRRRVEELFASTELQVCRDVANGTKHLRITRPSVDEHQEILRIYVPPNTDGASQNKLVLHAGGRSYGVREFCGECVRQIGEFMTSSSAVGR